MIYNDKIINVINNNNFKLKVTKFLGIGYSILLYFIYVIICIKILNIIFGNYYVNEYNIFKIIILFLIRLWLITIFVYLGKKSLKYIKFPLDGYNHKYLKGLVTGISLFTMFDYNLRLLVNEIITKI